MYCCCSEAIFHTVEAKDAMIHDLQTQVNTACTETGNLKHALMAVYTHPQHAAADSADGLATVSASAECTPPTRNCILCSAAGAPLRRSITVVHVVSSKS